MRNLDGVVNGRNLTMAARGALLLFALAVVSASLAAQERYVRQVRVQLETLEEKMEEEGFQRTHAFKIDKLPGDGTDSFTLTLDRGTDYVLASVCDTDCSDIDVKVYDENDNEVAEDTTVDDLPMVFVSPRWTGKFRIQITMYSCRQRVCYYGIGVFGRR